MNFSKYKAILFDVDKTLTNSNKEITHATKRAIQNVSAKGLLTGVCTGRQFATIQPTISDLFTPQALHIVAGGGQVITTTGEIKYEHAIDDEIVKKIEGIAEQNGSRIILQSGDTLYGNEKALLALSQTSISGKDAKKRLGLKELADWSSPLVVIVGVTPDLLHSIQSLPVDFKQMVNYSGEAYVDITAKGVSKGSGIGQWCTITGIQPEEIIGFGDSENDEEFLKCVGYSVAMGNAIDSLKKVVNEVTDDCDHDGVANWIKKNIV